MKIKEPTLYFARGGLSDNEMIATESIARKINSLTVIAYITYQISLSLVQVHHISKRKKKVNKKQGIYPDISIPRKTNAIY